MMLLLVADPSNDDDARQSSSIHHDARGGSSRHPHPLLFPSQPESLFLLPLLLLRVHHDDARVTGSGTDCESRQLVPAVAELLAPHILGPRLLHSNRRVVGVVTRGVFLRHDADALDGFAMVATADALEERCEDTRWRVLLGAVVGDEAVTVIARWIVLAADEGL